VYSKTPELWQRKETLHADFRMEGLVKTDLLQYLHSKNVDFKKPLTLRQLILSNTPIKANDFLHSQKMDPMYETPERLS